MRELRHELLYGGPCHGQSVCGMEHVRRVMVVVPLPAWELVRWLDLPLADARPHPIAVYRRDSMGRLFHDCTVPSLPERPRPEDASARSDYIAWMTRLWAEAAIAEGLVQ